MQDRLPASTSASSSALTLPEIIMANDLITLQNFDTDEGRKSIVELIAPGTSLNALQIAASSGALNVFKWLDEKKLFKLHELGDGNGNTVLMLAAQNGHVHILKYILDGYPDYAHDLLEMRNFRGFTATEVAEEHLQYTATNFLAERALIEQMRVVNRETAEVIPEVPMDLSTFVYDGMLTTKGLLLMLHYQDAKTPGGTKSYLAVSDSELLQTLALFITSEENEMLLLLDDTSHRCVCKLEKHAGKTYIIVVDSTPSIRKSYIDGLALQIKSELPDRVDRIVLCKNETNQQTDRKHCSYFAVKNLRKLAVLKNMTSTVLGSHFVSIEKQNDVDVVTYRLPAAFMSLAQSPDGLTKYVADNSDEASVILRTNKQGEQQNLRQYAEQPREGFGVVTPAIIQDKHDSTKKIAQNNSVEYFKEKYNQRVVPTLFNSFDAASRQKKLQEVLDSHNASYLVVDIDTGKLKSRSPRAG
jgi:hypothetical protein